jgi:adenosyl cobinamide kinase/adenosyl cobinamide phosphate guanylyltransferase
MIDNSTGEGKSNKNDFTASQSDSIRRRRHIAQNCLLIWLDPNIDQSKQDCQNTLVQLRAIVNDVNIHTQRDEFIDFLNDMKAFLIVEDSVGQQIVPFVHDFIQVHAIYVFDSDNLELEQ